MKVEMEIEIEALNGLHKINGNLEAKVRNLETEISSTKHKVRIKMFTDKPPEVVRDQMLCF